MPKGLVQEKNTDVLTRGMMTKILITKNDTDAKAKMIMGGEAFDFGEEARAAVQPLGD